GTGTETGTDSLSARPHGQEGVPVTRQGRSELASGAGRAAALTGNEGVGGAQTPKRFPSACQWLLDPPSSDSGIVELKLKSRSRRTHGYATRALKGAMSEALCGRPHNAQLSGVWMEC